MSTNALPQQLSLLSSASVPPQFRLDERTRRSGLAHVAALRAQIQAQAAARNLAPRGRMTQNRSRSRNPDQAADQATSQTTGRNVAA